MAQRGGRGLSTTDPHSAHGQRTPIALPRCVHGFQQSLGETKSLFEASHKGSIRGVPFAFLFSRS